MCLSVHARALLRRGRAPPSQSSTVIADPPLSRAPTRAPATSNVVGGSQTGVDVCVVVCARERVVTVMLSSVVAAARRRLLLLRRARQTCVVACGRRAGGAPSPFSLLGRVCCRCLCSSSILWARSLLSVVSALPPAARPASAAGQERGWQTAPRLRVCAGCSCACVGWRRGGRSKRGARAGRGRARVGNGVS